MIRVALLLGVTLALWGGDALDEAVRRAWEADITLATAEGRAAAAGRAAEALPLEDPRLHVESSSFAREDLERPYIGVSWRPPQPALLLAERRRRAAATELRQGEAGTRRDEIEAAVHAAWLALLGAEARLAQARRLAAAEAAHTEVLARQVAAQLRSQLDGSDAELRSQLAMARVARCNENALVAEERLTALCGPTPRPLAPPLPLASASSGPGAAERSARAAAAAAAGEASLASAARWPWLSIEIGGTVPDDRDQAATRSDFEGKLTIDLPLLRSGAAGDAARAEADAWRRQALRLGLARQQLVARLRQECTRAEAAAHRAQAIYDGAAATIAARSASAAAAGGDPAALAGLALRLADLEGEAVECAIALWSARLALRRAERPLSGAP